MTGSSGVRNEDSGQVGGGSDQVGTAHGDVDVRQQAAGADELLAGDLAGAACELSREEAERARIGEPIALRVRWHAAETDLFEHWEDIDRSAAHGVAVPLSGHFATIRETVQATESQRLLVLGRAGAGKTALAHRLILDLLEHRDHRGPVPVLFSLGDWDPTTTGLRDWMVGRLVRDHPFLDQRDAAGKRGAEVLVERDWILPVLDGFDEIPDRRRTDAISRISQVQLPLLLTSRPEEYAQAGAANAVGRAAAIEIDDLTLDQAEEHLCRSTGPSRTAEWAAVFEQLRTAPQQAANRNLIPALTTPLMVMLARARYERADEHAPGELLDTVRFPTSAALERHLLNSYVDTAYDPRRTATPPVWGTDRAHHWLGYLATRLKARDTHDFTWWQLPAFLAPPIRVLATTAMFALTGWFTGGLANGLAFGFAAGLADGLAFGLAVGLAVGFACGLFKEVGFFRGRTGREPERLRLYRQRRDRQRRRFKRAPLVRAASEFTDGLVFGLVFGLTVGLVFGLVLGLALSVAGAFASGPTGVLVLAGAPAAGLATGFAAGLALGVVLGVVNIVVAVLGEEHGPQDNNPWQLITTDRTTTLARTIPAGLLGAILYSLLMASMTSGTSGKALLSGITSALVLGSLVGLLRLAFSAWGNWLLFARLWLPLTGRLPWRPQRFLEDAYDRGILRRAGAAYQFRHVQLRDHLADQHRKPRKGRSPAPAASPQ